MQGPDANATALPDGSGARPASPKTPAPPRPDGPHPAIISSHPAQARILVVDDTVAIHNDFRKILAREETSSLAESEAALFGVVALPQPRRAFELDSAFQGQEGLERMKQALAEGQPYGIAFVDVRMPPGWDGVETARKLWEAYPDLQVVICTAYSDYSWEDMVHQLGHSANLFFLKKPFDSVEVLQLAHSLTQKWHLTQQSRRQLADLDDLVNQRTQRVSRLNRLYSVLSKINELIVRARSLEVLYQEACRIAVEDGLFRMTWVGLVDPGSGVVKPVACAGLEEGYLREIHITAKAQAPEGIGPIGTAIRERRYDICNDVEQDPRLGPWIDQMRRRGYRSLAAFPLLVKEVPLGALALYSGEPHSFNQEEISLLQQLAADLSFAGEFLQQKKQLQLQGAALESAANSIVLTDAAGVVLWHNMAFTRLTGYGASETLGRKLNLLKSGRHGPEFYQHLWRTVMCGQVWRGEITNRRKDGTLVQEEMTITPVVGDTGEITHYVAIKQDITERKRTEQRAATFAKLGQQLSAAKTAQEVARIILDVADQWLGWDAAMCDLYSPAENLVTSVLSIDLVEGRRTEYPPIRPHAPPSPLAQLAIQHGGQLVLRDATTAASAHTVPFGNQTQRSLSVLYVPIRNGPEVTGLLSIQSYSPRAYDQASLETLQALADHCGGALDRIKAEAALHLAQEQLRQSQKMEAIGQLAGGVAHDFNNLLAVIRGNAELVLMGRGKFKGDPNECLKQVTAAADRAANLTRQLLTFGRKQVMQLQLLNLNEVVGNLAKMLKRIIGEDIQLQCDYAARLPLIKADLSMMEQVLLNLVVNARDAMPRGGQLQVQTATASFDAAFASAHSEAHPGDFVVLSVSDTGSGIEPEFLPRIFEPFFTTKEFGKGTGLGLATVYGIVKQHSGWIDVVSLVGVGSTFKIFIPMAEAPPAAAVEPPREPAPRGGTETILLVEDDDAVRELTRLLLESYGYHVHEAPSGREAVPLWDTIGTTVDLLLTDVIMPHGVNGRELAERLCRQRPELKVIFMSGYSGDTLDTDFHRRNQAPFLQKPCSASDLLQTVRQTLDATRLA